MKYRCGSCGKDISKSDIKGRLRCPYCGGKMIFKKRPEVVKRVKAE
jgi:DNA-directed RNA polymerase subunit P